MKLELIDINLLANLKKTKLIYIFSLIIGMFLTFAFMLSVLEFSIISKQTVLTYENIEKIIEENNQKKDINSFNFDSFFINFNYKIYPVNKKIFVRNLSEYTDSINLSFEDFIKAKLFYNNVLRLKIKKENKIVVFTVNFTELNKIFDKILLIYSLVMILLVVMFLSFLKKIYYTENKTLKSIIKESGLLNINVYNHEFLFDRKISELEKIYYFCKFLVDKLIKNIKDIENSMDNFKKSIRKMDIIIPFSESEKEIIYQKNEVGNIVAMSDIALKKMSLLKQLFLFKSEIEKEINVSSVYLKIRDFLKNILGLETFVLFEVNVFRNYRKIKVLNGILEKEIICLKSVDTDIYLCKAIRSETVIISDHKYKKCTSCNMNRFKKYSNYSVICIPFSIDKEWDMEVQIYLPKENNSDNEEEIELLTKQVYSVLSISKSVLQSLYLKEKLENYSYKDGLTQLYNRRFLETKIIDYLNDVNSYCVVIFDIDHFKKINDTYGHDNGDLILKEFANILNVFTNENHDFYAIRYGGEEFVVILLNRDYSFAYGFAQRIKEAFASKTFTFKTGVSNFSVSGGISCYKKEEDKIKDFYTVLKEADQALYYSKNHGRNRISIWKEIKQYLKEEEKSNQELNKEKLLPFKK